MEKDPFKEYIRQSEPNMRDKVYVWHTLSLYDVMLQKANFPKRH